MKFGPARSSSALSSSSLKLMSSKNSSLTTWFRTLIHACMLTFKLKVFYIEMIVKECIKVNNSTRMDMKITLDKVALELKVEE